MAAARPPSVGFSSASRQAREAGNLEVTVQTAAGLRTFTLPHVALGRRRATPHQGCLLAGLAVLVLLVGSAAGLSCHEQLPTLRVAPLPEALSALHSCAGDLEPDWPETVSPFALVDVINELCAPFPEPAGHAVTSLRSAQLFPEAALLEAAWQDIAEEAAAVLRSHEVPEFSSIEPTQAHVYAAETSSWKMFMLRLMGADVEPHLAACPRTAALLARCAGVRNAFFSVLAPGAVLAQHRGPQRAVVRYQLGLIVPEPEACELRVQASRLNASGGGEPQDDVYHWREGEGVLWDDMRLHSASNRGSQPRVVLMLDVRRRDVGARTRALDAAATSLLRATPAFERVLRRAEAPPAKGSGGRGLGFELRR